MNVPNVKHKLTNEELEALRSYKGVRNGANLFLDLLEKIYKDESDVLEYISFCRSIKDSMDWIETWPAHEKTRNLYYKYMDDLFVAIGYSKEDDE